MDTCIKSTNTNSTTKLLNFEKYKFESSILEDSILELKLTNTLTEVLFVKTFTLYKLKNMSPLLYFKETTEEIVSTISSKLEKQQFDIEESEKNIILNIHFTIDEERCFTPFKLLKFKGKALEINKIENFRIKKAEESDVPIILNLIKELALYEKSPEKVVMVRASC